MDGENPLLQLPPKDPNQKALLQCNTSQTYYIWRKVFKNGPSNICGRQPLKI